MISPAASSRPAGGGTRLGAVAVLACGLLMLILVCLISLMIGARPVPASGVLHALLAYDPSSADDIAVRDYRLPRTLLGLLCGAAFGAAGALMQAATRNPLADPGLLGVNAGAGFLVAIAVMLGVQDTFTQLWFAFGGAILATIAVHACGTLGRNGANPVGLLLAGVAITAILGGLVQAITLLNPVAFDGMRAWSVGALAGRGMEVVAAVTPFVLAGLAIALLIAPALNAVALGEDLARSLGAPMLRTRLWAALAVTLLAGAGTAAVGPIGFVGLMMPHVARWLLGPDQKRIVCATMILSPLLLISADILGRLVLQPGELEAGIVTAFLGAPVLILLVRRRQVSRL